MRVKKYLLILCGLCTLSQNAWTQRLTLTALNLNQPRLEFAKEAIRLYGDKIPAHAQSNILKQQIIIGMSPYEAKLAAGAFYYKVEADSKVWPINSDPLVVIDKQSIAPDESKIWMTFETETQFPGEGKTRFEVYFNHGKVQAIKKLTEK